MANRLEQEFPKMNLRLSPPLIGPDGLQRDLATEVARQGEIESWAEGRVGASVRTALNRVLAWLRAELRRPPALTPHFR